MLERRFSASLPLLVAPPDSEFLTPDVSPKFLLEILQEID